MAMIVESCSQVAGQELEPIGIPIISDIAIPNGFNCSDLIHDANEKSRNLPWPCWRVNKG